MNKHSFLGNYVWFQMIYSRAFLVILNMHKSFNFNLVFFLSDTKKCRKDSIWIIWICINFAAWRAMLEVSSRNHLPQGKAWVFADWSSLATVSEEWPRSDSRHFWCDYPLLHISKGKELSEITGKQTTSLIRDSTDKQTLQMPKGLAFFFCCCGTN